MGPFPLRPRSNSSSKLSSALYLRRPTNSAAGRARVYATGMVDGAQATVLTALVDRPANFAGAGPLRVAEVISWKERGGQWAAVALLNASILPQDLLTPTADGRSLVQGWQKFVSASSP